MHTALEHEAQNCFSNKMILGVRTQSPKRYSPPLFTGIIHDHHSDVYSSGNTTPYYLPIRRIHEGKNVEAPLKQRLF